MDNQFALAILNGNSSISTGLGRKSLKGLSAMFDEYAEKRLIHGIFVQRHPVELIIQMINAKADFLKQTASEEFETKYLAIQLLESTITCLEKWTDSKSINSELEIAQQVVSEYNNFAKKHSSKLLPDNYVHVLANILSVAVFVLTPDQPGVKFEEADAFYTASMKTIVSQLKCNV